MSYTNYPLEKYKFRWILNEMNYGSLQKDKRITSICNTIKDSILENLQYEDNLTTKFGKRIFLDIQSQYKKAESNKIKLLWNFNFSEQLSPTFFCKGAGLITYSKDNYEIEFDIIKAEGMSDENFRKKFKEFITSNEIDKIMIHEIKHLVDKVDEVFTKKNVYKDIDLTSDKAYSKYMSGNKEIDAFLATVITDLKDKIDKYPDMSLETALHNSLPYSSFIQYIHKSKLIKYKQKIFYFWRDYKGLE